MSPPPLNGAYPKPSFLVTLQHLHSPRETALHSIERRSKQRDLIAPSYREFFKIELSLTNLVGQLGKPSHRSYHSDNQDSIQDEKGYYGDTTR
jgi:hypothetical protein